MASEFPITITSAIIAYYKNHVKFSQDIWFGERVAISQRYSNGWKTNALGLSVRPDGGESDNFTHQQVGRLECRIYGPTPESCDDTFAWIERDIQDFNRTVIKNEFLLQMLVLETQPTYLRDPDVDLDMYMYFVRAAVRTDYLEGV